MQLLLTSCLALALGAAQALAVPAPASEALELPHVEVARAGVTTLSASQLSGLAPYTQFARAAYCDSSKITGWQCGRRLFPHGPYIIVADIRIQRRARPTLDSSPLLLVAMEATSSCVSTVCQRASRAVI